MRKFFAIILIVVLSLGTLLMFSACNDSGESGAESDSEFRPANSPNDDTVLEYDIPADGDLEAHKQLADTLYNIANRNDQLVEKRAYATNFITLLLSGSIETKGYRYEVKNGTEYAFTDYSFGGETGLSVLASAFDAVYVKRSYTNSWMDDMYVERVSTSNSKLYVVSTEDDTYYGQDGKVFGANWEDGEGNSLTVSHVEKPYYYADQEQKFHFNDNTISAETMESARVSHNDEEGFYSIEFSLDMNNPLSTSVTLPNLRLSSNNENAYYTKVSGIIEIWDNGYYKSFQSFDGFVIPMGPLEVDSDLDYQTFFYYDDASCDIAEYQYMVDVATKCYAEATGGDYEAEIYSSVNPRTVAGDVFVAMIVVVIFFGAAVAVKRFVK